MKKFFIIANEYHESEERAKQLKTLLLKKGLIEDFINPEIVVVIGGDGTLLSAIQHYNSILDKITFLTINSGSLGFMSFFTVEQIDDIVLLMETNKLNTYDFDLLEVNLNEKIIYGLNEIRLINTAKTLEVNVYINNEFLQRFKGTALNIATKVGSSGFNRAVNGPILATTESLLVMTEVAPVSNKIYQSLNSPLVLSATDEIKISENFKGANLVIDGFLYEIAESQEAIAIKLSQKKIKFFYQKGHEHSIISRLVYAFKHIN